MWPPDAFAFAAALLRRTGAYTLLVNDSRLATRVKQDRPEGVGRTWRAKLDAALGRGGSNGSLRHACPPEIKGWWDSLRAARQEPLEACTRQADLTAALIDLCVAGDEASVQIGVGAGERSPFLLVADTILINNDGRSFCLRIPVDKLGVLGKQHTPQRGCSIRSLSHNLSLYTPTEIAASWESPMPQVEVPLDVFNLLLLPWPLQVEAGDFSVSPGTGRSGAPSDPGRRYFEYAPRAGLGRTPRTVGAMVRRAVRLASARTDRIHAIVLPELALTIAEFAEVEAVAIESGAILIAGVRGHPSRETSGLPFNACVIQPLGLSKLGRAAKTRNRLWDLARHVQIKHHRWCLDRNQILQYELGSRLPASGDCWERVYLGDRRITFVTFKEWLTTCVLICEDLARQEPVTEVIRAVGPNLVFALLMDGPQLRNRWPSRYASVLAEDPGCSVLSLTSLGMSTRSRPARDAANPVDRSRTIALWRDSVYGEREIELPPEADACVLSLVCRTERERTIDGRPEPKPSHFPVFAGMVPLSTQARPEGRKRYTRNGKR